MILARVLKFEKRERKEIEAFMRNTILKTTPFIDYCGVI